MPVIDEATVSMVDSSRSSDALALLVRAFREDPTCQFAFDRNSTNFERRMSAYFEAGNADHFARRQPVFGIFCAGRLAGVAYLRCPGCALGLPTLLRWLGATREFSCAARLSRYFRGVKRYVPRHQFYTVVVLGIEPELQRMGYGTKLMEFLQEYCDRDAEKAGILLDTGNSGNIAFYRRLGYNEIGRVRLDDDLTQTVMLRAPTARADSVKKGDLRQEPSRRESFLLERPGLVFETTADQPSDLVPLVENVQWGTRGTRYRVTNFDATLRELPPRLHFTGRREGKLLATRIAIRKTIIVNNNPRDAFYHSLFCVHPNEQGKGYGTRLAQYTLDQLETRLERNGFIYAYIEEGNERSAAVASSLGYQRLGDFHVHAISRAFPKHSLVAKRCGPDSQPMLSRLLEERYRDHSLTDFSLSLKAEEYWTIDFQGTPLAGAQVLPQLWRIDKLPGLGGAMAVKVLPHVPILRRVFSPQAWRFLKLGNIYFQPGRPDAFFELVEGLLRRYELTTAVLYIDHRSQVYEELRASRNFGSVDLFVRNKVSVWAYLKHLPQDQTSFLYNQPLFISPIDV